MSWFCKTLTACGTSLASCASLKYPDPTVNDAKIQDKFATSGLDKRFPGVPKEDDWAPAQFNFPERTGLLKDWLEGAPRPFLSQPR
jgi:hypothetical protein